VSTLLKYPRTPHLQGSRLQPGDADSDALPFSAIADQHVVVEEKLDGGNCAVSFAPDGELRLQSRGHFLTGGARETQFSLFKTWANRHAQALRRRLGSRYVMYGEWTFAKHTIFYDALPHYFHEFDIYDRENGHFLSTSSRRALLEGAPVVAVPVLHEGPADRYKRLVEMIGPSLYKSCNWRSALRDAASEAGQPADRVDTETDASDHMEGLYIKIEREGRTIDRCKYVRASFLDTVQASGSHWMDRPILPNRLASGVDIFAGED
jgi:hypothetical protein